MTTPDVEEKIEIQNALISFLLYERREETEVRTAFAALVQERHHQFHDKDEYTDTNFTECGNVVCVSALGILQNARKARIEFNEFAMGAITNTVLKVKKENRMCIAYLEDKIEAPPEEHHPEQGLEIV